MGCPPMIAQRAGRRRGSQEASRATRSRTPLDAAPAFWPRPQPSPPRGCGDRPRDPGVVRHRLDLELLLLRRLSTFSTRRTAVQDPYYGVLTPPSNWQARVVVDG